jgi:hypothetical protein
VTSPTNDSMAREGAPVYRDPQDEIDAIERRLRVGLTREQYELVERIEHLMNDLELRMIGRLVDGIAAHFPAFAPAILAVHAHVRETGDLWPCELEVGKQTWPGFTDCADAARPPKLHPRQAKKEPRAS